jgi:hypothetical protein
LHYFVDDIIHRTKTQETKNTNPEKNNILKKFLVIVNNRFDFLLPTHKKERIHKKNTGAGPLNLNFS